jgi:hypothetical protein
MISEDPTNLRWLNRNFNAGKSLTWKSAKGRLKLYKDGKLMLAMRIKDEKKIEGTWTSELRDEDYTLVIKMFDKDGKEVSAEPLEMIV